MKKIVGIVLLNILLLTLFSCDKKDGDWDDNILLSSKSEIFNSNGDSITITTQGDWWWISDIMVDDVNFYPFEAINVEDNQYRIEDDCFIVEKIDKNTLWIKVAENPSNVERIVSIGLQAGDYFDRITITQNGKITN